MDTCPRSFLDLAMLWEHREDSLQYRTGRVPSPDRMQVDRFTWYAELAVRHALHTETARRRGHQGDSASRCDEQDHREDLLHPLLDPGMRVGEEPNRQVVEVPRPAGGVADHLLVGEVARHQGTAERSKPMVA